MATSHHPRIMDREGRERIVSTIRCLFPHFCAIAHVDAPGAFLRLHVPSEGLSWPFAVKTIPTGTRHDEWARDAAAFGDDLWNDEATRRYAVSSAIGSALRIPRGIVCLWGVTEKVGIPLLVAASLSLALITREDARAIMSDFGGDISQITGVLDTVYGS